MTVAADRETISTTFPADWYGLVGMYGGFVLAALADAAHCREGFSLTTLTARFLRPTEPGDVTIARRIVHSGRRTAAVELDLTQGGRLMATASAVLVPLDDVPSEDAVLSEVRRPPTSSPPATWSSRRHVQGDLAFLGHLDVRTPTTIDPLQGSAAWLRLSAGGGGDLATGPAIACALMDALLPVAFAADDPPAFVPTIEFSAHFTPRIHRLDRTQREWLFGRNRLEWRTGSYCMEDATLTDSRGRLLTRLRQVRLIQMHTQRSTP